MPAAATLAAITLLAVTAALTLVGWRDAAVMFAFAGCPIAGLALSSSAHVFVLGRKALGEARRQLAELEAERSEP
jgi:hypothetical protein